MFMVSLCTEYLKRSGHGVEWSETTIEAHHLTRHLLHVSRESSLLTREFGHSAIDARESLRECRRVVTRRERRARAVLRRLAHPLRLRSASANELLPEIVNAHQSFSQVLLRLEKANIHQVPKQTL